MILKHLESSNFKKMAIAEVIMFTLRILINDLKRSKLASPDGLY